MLLLRRNDANETKFKIQVGAIVSRLILVVHLQGYLLTSSQIANKVTLVKEK